MKTFRLILVVMIAFLFNYAELQAQVFVIERGTSTTLTFDNIKAAVDALQDNDRLFIPPGTHDLNGYKWTGYEDNQNHNNILVVNKKVAIYGAGYSEGANSSVIKGGRFIIGKNANGTLITGVRFDDEFYLDNVSNCIVTRCKMNGYFYLNGTGSNINISECDFSSYVSTSGSSYMSGGSGLMANFTKCIFRTNWLSLNTATINNSLFLQLSSYSFNNCSLSNNIFIVSQTVTNSRYNINGSDNTFSYNLWVGGYTETAATNNNTFKSEMDRETYANVFVDATKGDYQLKSACIGKNAGSDNTDVGIFGSAVPFKENKLPSIPSFLVKVISQETDAAGKLPVNIVIEAQER